MKDKTLKKLLLASCLILGLAACGSKETVIIEREVEKTQPTVVEEYEKPANSQYSNEDLFISTFRSEYPNEYYAFGEDLLIETGYTICDSIDQGMTLLDLADSAIQNDLDIEMVGFLAGAAVSAFCPKNMWWIERYGA
jgi:hypothetical protein